MSDDDLDPDPLNDPVMMYQTILFIQLVKSLQDADAEALKRVLQRKGEFQEMAVKMGLPKIVLDADKTIIAALQILLFAIEQLKPLIPSTRECEKIKSEIRKGWEPT